MNKFYWIIIPFISSKFKLKTTLPYIITHISTFIWIIIPFRQRHEKYFMYFLFNAISDPLTLLLRIVFHSGSNIFYIAYPILILAALRSRKTWKKYWVFYIIGSIIFSIIIEKYFNFTTEIIIDTIFHSMILYIFLKAFVLKVIKTQKLNIFIFLLIFTELLIITKDISLLTGFTNGYVYFYLTNGLQLLIGIFFYIFKENDRRIEFQFSKDAF